MSSVGTWGAGAVAGTRGFVLLFSTNGLNFRDKEGCWDYGHMLRRGDVVFFRGSTQLDWTMWGKAGRVEDRFRSSKGGHLRDGTVMVRARADPTLPLRYGGGAVEWMIELLYSCMFLPSHAPLAAFGTARGNWSVWTQAQATAALRGVVALAGLPANEYALHSLRIGGATFLSAGEGVGRCSTGRTEMEVGCMEGLRKIPRGGC